MEDARQTRTWIDPDGREWKVTLSRWGRAVAFEPAVSTRMLMFVSGDTVLTATSTIPGAIEDWSDVQLLRIYRSAIEAS